MTLSASPSPRWWAHRATLRRVLSDLLASELAHMRPGLARRPPPWPPELDLVANLGADSLELLGLATAMEQWFGGVGVNGVNGGTGQDRILADPRLNAWCDALALGLDAGADVIRFRTSGSSGAPKTCTHALAELWQESRELAALFPGTRRIVGLVPAHHIYGFLFTVLLPHALGLDPAAVADLRGVAPGALAGRLQPGDLVVGFPDFWRAFAPVACALTQGVTGVTSSAPCPDEVARAVAHCGIARLVQVYGSSETAGVGWRDSPDADYRLLSYWEAQESDRDAQGVAEAGRLADGDPPRGQDRDQGQGQGQGGSAAALIRTCADGRRLAYPLQDRLAWSAPGRFRPLGRIDAAVQVGGINVFPGYVADVLRMCPEVEDATVRLMRPDEGGRLKAFVVPRGGGPVVGGESGGESGGKAGRDAGAALRAVLTAWMAERLCTPECPAAYSFGPALPRHANGKLADWIIDAGA